MEIKYQYSDPVERGYTKFKLTKKQHNKLFKYRRFGWSERYEYFYSENDVILHKLYNWKLISAFTFSFPLLVLLYGIGESWRELKSLYNQKKVGSFVGDTVSSGTEKYNEIMEVIKRR